VFLFELPESENVRMARSGCWFWWCAGWTGGSGDAALNGHGVWVGTKKAVLPLPLRRRRRRRCCCCGGTPCARSGGGSGTISSRPWALCTGSGYSKSRMRVGNGFVQVEVSGKRIALFA